MNHCLFPKQNQTYKPHFTHYTHLTHESHPVIHALKLFEHVLTLTVMIPLFSIRLIDIEVGV